jgi:hypothetical protein
VSKPLPIDSSYRLSVIFIAVSADNGLVLFVHQFVELLLKWRA